MFNFYIYSDEPTGNLALVFELMEMNLYEAIKDRKKYLSERKAKNWIYQTLKALDFMHRNGIFHRDIKPENILLCGEQVKLADLGSCKGMYSKPPFTEYISTRWYRSPECLLTDGYYNYKMDIWGLGCVFFELLTLVPLFPGDDEIDEVNKINYILGSPSEELFQKFIKNSVHGNDVKYEYQKGIGIQRFLTHVSPQCVDLINKMLVYDPDKRLTAKQCLNHECFKDLVEQDLKMTKMSQINFYQNSLLMKSFNDSASCIKMDDSIQYINNNNNNNNSQTNQNNNNSHSHSKTEITAKHSILLSTYYEYSNPDEKEKDLNQLLADMSFYGEITKKEILNEKEINPNKFIS